VKFAGDDTLYSSAGVGKYWRIGDPEVVNPLGGIGLNGLIIGGTVQIADQETIISLTDGTTTRISQQLRAEDGKASVSAMDIGMIDENDKATQMITPDLIFDDILARDANVWIGFTKLGFPTDFVKIHSGIVDEVSSNAGLVKFSIAHPDQLKRSSIFRRYESTLGFYTISASNNKLDFKQGANTYLVTIANGVYTGTDLAAAIAAGINGAGTGNTYYCNYFVETSKFEIFTNAVVNLQLLTSSGANIATSIFPTLGFTGLDHAGENGYQSDENSISVNKTDTSITVQDASGFLQKVLGPNGGYDSSFESYVRIDDEVIKFDTISGNTLQSCERGAFGTFPANHGADASVISFYRLKGAVIDLAQKVMVSGFHGAYETGMDVSSFVHVGPLDTIDDAVFFGEKSLYDDYGVFAGDYMTVSGAINAGNNGTYQVQEIGENDYGFYVKVVGATFTAEIDSTAVVSFRSQFDTLPDGLKLHPKFIDSERHDFYRRTFLSSFEMDFYLKDDVNAKSFIDEQLYVPCGAYSLPRSGKCSLGYHIPPLPAANITTLSEQNIINPDKLNLMRSLGSKFYNTVLIKYDDGVLEDKLFSGAATISATSQSRIPVGNKVLTIESLGLKSGSGGLSQALKSATARLNRYKFGAEYLNGIETFYENLKVEAGDIVLMDYANLHVSNTVAGDRLRPAQLMEVENRYIDILSGKVILDLTSTDFTGSTRYGLISPSSKIKTGLSQTQFVIEETGFSRFAEDEFKKWTSWLTAQVLVRSADYSTRYANATLTSIAGNTITVDTALGFTPQAGDYMELYLYSSQVFDNVKLVYGFMRNAPAFADGKPPYGMI
jgi:hypothetical protein